MAINSRQNPEISVLMPTYNAVAYLDAAVLSILSQRFQDWELLAFDDASSDGSYEKLEFWATQDARIKVSRPYDSHGNYTQICNEMIDSSTGKYIARMDADDISLPNRLDRTVEFLKNIDTAVAVGAVALALVEQGGTNQLTSDFPWLKRCVAPTASVVNPVNHHLRAINRVVHSTVLMKREDVVNTGGYDDLFPLEDWDLMLKLSSVGDVFVLPEILGVKRQHDMNHSKQHPNLQNAFRTINSRHSLGLDKLPSTSAF